MAISSGAQSHGFGAFILNVNDTGVQPSRTPNHGPQITTPDYPETRQSHLTQSNLDQSQFPQIVPFAEDFNTSSFRAQILRGHETDNDSRITCSIELDSSFERFLYSDLDAYDDFWHSIVLIGNLDKPSSPDFDAVWATTVQHYVTRVWPNSIQAIRATFNAMQSCLLYRKHAQETISKSAASSLTINAFPGASSSLTMVLQGRSGDVADVCEALSWQATNVQAGKNPRHPSAVFTDLVDTQSDNTYTSRDPRRPISHALTLKTRVMPDIVPRPGTCWKTLFPRTSCAGKFWRPTRPREMQGLELTFDLLCFLAGLEYYIVQDGGLILYGKSSMVYPVSQTKDGVQWHFQELDYTDRPFSIGKRLLVNDLNTLRKATRHFLGLWLDARVRLGTNECDGSEITPSNVESVSRMLSTDGLTIGGAIATPTMLHLEGTQKFKIARSRRNRHMVSFEANLRERVTMPVLLYCPSERRAWMVPYVSVLLHMARAGAKRQHDGRSVIPACKASTNGGYAAFSRIRDCRDQLLHLDTVDMTTCTVRQYVDKLSAKLETARREICRARAFYPEISESLFGFDFTDAASENSTLALKRHDLSTSSKRRGWTPLLDDVQLVLFCESLSDPLLPGCNNDFSGPCGDTTWKTVPTGFDILACYLPCLTYSAESRNLAGLKRLTSDRYWSCRHQLFGNCIRTDNHTCSRLQELSKKHDNCPSIPMKLAKESGVAIFRYKEKTNDIIADLARRGTLAGVQFIDSRYCSSTDRSGVSTQGRTTPRSTPLSHTRETSGVSNTSTALTNATTLVTRSSTRQSKFSRHSGKGSPLSIWTDTAIGSPQSQHQFENTSATVQELPTPQLESNFTPSNSTPNSAVSPAQETGRYYRKGYDEKRRRNRWNCFTGVT